MLSQTVLPFKLESTDETLTAHGGLVLFGEYCQGMGLAQWLDQELPAPGSGAGYAPSTHAQALLLMLHGGGRSLEDVRTLRSDTGLLELLQIRTLPSSDALGDWLRRVGAVGMTGFERVHRRLLRRLLGQTKDKAHTLDIDATQIIAEKQTAQYTYKGEVGYMPMVGHLAETGLVVGAEFRDGNAAPAARNLDFIQTCESQLPSGHRIAAVRADSAAYQAEVFNHCETHGQTFAIGAARDAAVNAAIAAIAEHDWTPWRDGEIAETVHSMNSTRHAFRLIVMRRGAQGELFEHTAPWHYSVIASNRRESTVDTLAWYRQRGDASENRIKELKLGFGMERMPCGQFDANAAFFQIGVLAYNLFKGFTREVMGAAWCRRQVQTLRWQLYQTAGKIVRHAGGLYLKVSRAAVAQFESIRQRCWALSVTGVP